MGIKRQIKDSAKACPERVTFVSPYGADYGEEFIFRCHAVQEAYEHRFPCKKEDGKVQVASNSTSIPLPIPFLFLDPLALIPLLFR